MLRSRNRLRRFNRRNPQAPVWGKPLFTDNSAVWRRPLFRNPDEDLDDDLDVDLNNLDQDFGYSVPMSPPFRRYNPQPPVWGKPLFTDNSAVWRGPLFRNPDELALDEEITMPLASRRHFRRRNPEEELALDEEITMPLASRRHFRHRNPQAPVWNEPTFTTSNAASAWTSGPLFRNPDEELDLREEIIAPTAARRHFRRRNPQPPVWGKPLFTDNSAVWRGPLFRNPDDTMHDDLMPAPLASRRRLRRHNPQPPVWGQPTFTTSNAASAWTSGPLFRNPDEEETCDICHLRKNPYRS